MEPHESAPQALSSTQHVDGVDDHPNDDDDDDVLKKSLSKKRASRRSFHLPPRLALVLVGGLSLLVVVLSVTCIVLAQKQSLNSLAGTPPSVATASPDVTTAHTPSTTPLATTPLSTLAASTTAPLPATTSPSTPIVSATPSTSTAAAQPTPSTTLATTPLSTLVASTTAPLPATTSPSTPIVSATPSASTAAKAQPILLCLGDSNTEYSSRLDVLGWEAQLAADYVRRADVINRGAAGWTTEMWGSYLPTLLAEWAAKPPTLVLLMLGTNDARRGPLHVPVQDYRVHLQTLVEGIQTSWRSRILLVTPLPVDEAGAASGFEQYSNANTGECAVAVLQIGAQLNVPVLDLWTPLQGQLSTLFLDGVHLNRNGNVVVHTMLQQKIADVFPDLLPTNIARLYTFGAR
ncbi:Aste57867_8240 [Aphanomyces stellatus]|uniref:Aste57867_8240 protein n=1 Tax=Aphanomyces stellatus TaxID=120398 RepID=A0A485KJS4_9STRA|nr:hypothetical protein As57867_008209 [Aphanomyces stellatus]VFT85127.1 Aste57867_8240 [Aphanomyces stellatus]